MDNEQLVSVLQSVISPVVLISGVGMLVLSMTNRFSHAQDRVRHLVDDWRKLDQTGRERVGAQIRIFRRRLRLLVLAIALGLASVLLAVLLIITLFANYLIGTTFRGLVVIFFALSLLSLVASLLLFIRDMTLSLNALQEELQDIPLRGGKPHRTRVNTMKQHLFAVVVLIALSSIGSAQDAKFTVEQARKLLPQAAGISNADFKALSKDPRADAVKSKSLSLVLLALRPPKNLNAANEFRILGDNIKVSDITDAMWISKDKGYASFIQPKYITECTCESTAKRAEGIVTFKHDLFAGRIPFVAEATKDGWIITEFRLPQYKTRVVRGKDGVWSQEALKDR